MICISGFLGQMGEVDIRFKSLFLLQCVFVMAFLLNTKWCIPFQERSLNLDRAVPLLPSLSNLPYYTCPSFLYLGVGLSSVFERLSGEMH